MDDLARRWQTPDGERLRDLILERIVSHGRLDNLGIPECQGRLDLRGFISPNPAISGRVQAKGWSAQKLGGLMRIEGVRLAGLDLSGARLEGWRIFDSSIADCRLDGAHCRDWRLWAVEVTNTSFAGADLRRAVLGAWFEGRGDVYRWVQFTEADMRGIVCPAATFVDCDFGTARLEKVDFQSSSFVRCRFSGTLREVIFYDRGFKTGKPDANPMEEVDFSDADLRMVEFRRLNLDHVRLPSSADQIVIRHYRCVLDKAMRELQSDPRRKRLHAALEHQLRWAGPSQEVGLLSLRDIVELQGEAEARFCGELLRRLEAECDHTN